jgi:hypothetical protein
VYLNFVAFLASYVTPFLLMFQSSQPLVHVLYQKANELVQQCMLLLTKPGIVAENEGHDLTEVDCERSENWLERGKMTIDCGTEHALQSVQDRKRNGILLKIRSCLKTTTAYLQKHLPISNPVLRDLQCLHPLARKQAIGRATVGRLCQHLKKASKTDVFVDKVDAEWLLYMALKEVDAFTPQITADMCTYWSNVSKVTVNGSKMFPHLSHLAKASLTILHGNAVTECRFSVNTALLSKDRMLLDETTIQAIRRVRNHSFAWSTHCCPSDMKYDQCSAACSLKVLDLPGKGKAGSCSRSCMKEGSHTNSGEH